MKSSWHIDRRTCLRGAGAALGLPFLEAMVPGGKRARADEAPKRMVVFVFTGGTPDDHGYIGEGRDGSFRPSTAGTDYQLTPILQPLAALKSDVTIISNLHNAVAEIGSQAIHKGGSIGDHGRSGCAILTGVNPEWIEKPTRRIGISVDQLAANALRKFTPALPSLVLSNPAHPDFLLQNPVWASPTTMVKPVTQASDAFGMVFGDSADPAAQARSRNQTMSVLHHAKAHADSLKKKLGAADRETLDRYFTSVQDLEARIASSSDVKSCGTLPPAPMAIPETPDQYVNIDLPGHLKKLSDMIALAFQCDRTRVVTVLLRTHGMHFGWLKEPYADFALNWHDNVEHGGSHDNVNRELALDSYTEGARSQVEQFAYLVQKLKDTPEGNGTGSVLDNTAMFCTSEIQYGNGHSMRHLPVIVAGGASGIQSGRHIVVPDTVTNLSSLTASDAYYGPSASLQPIPGQPIANLYVTMLNAIGVRNADGGPVTNFGNSTGALPRS